MKPPLVALVAAIIAFALFSPLSVDNSVAGPRKAGYQNPVERRVTSKTTRAYEKPVPRGGYYGPGYNYNRVNGAYYKNHIGYFGRPYIHVGTENGYNGHFKWFHHYHNEEDLPPWVARPRDYR